MRYLTYDDVLKIHRRMIEVFGGEDGLLSGDSLENCVALPMMSVFKTETSPSLWSKAAALLHCIATRHPFVDGNKRTAWVAAKVFLRVNGVRLSARVEEAERIVVGVAKGGLDSDQLAEWMKIHSAGE